MADESTGTEEATQEGGEDTKVEVKDVGASQTPETDTEQGDEEGSSKSAQETPTSTTLADLTEEALRALIREVASDVALEALAGFGIDIDKKVVQMDEARQALLVEIRTGREASEAEVVAGVTSIVDDLGNRVAKAQSSAPELRAELVRAEQRLRREIAELCEGMKYLNEQIDLWKGVAQNLARILEARKVLQELRPTPTQPEPNPTQVPADTAPSLTQPESRPAPDLPDFLRDVR